MPEGVGAIRMLNDAAMPGVANMARDEALLIAIGRGGSRATLRLYEWDPPTISLGYFQPFADYEALAKPAGALSVVRRTTGGGAILHDRELTYSIVVPAGHPMVSGRPMGLYRVVHEAIIACLRQSGAAAEFCSFTDDSGPRRGPFFCFARRHGTDVLVGNDKLAGSAQRRTREAVLQHGSIVVERRFVQQPSATAGTSGWTVAALREALPVAIGELIGTRFEWGEWSKEELSLTAELEEKYGSDAWTRRA